MTDERIGAVADTEDNPEAILSMAIAYSDAAARLANAALSQFRKEIADYDSAINLQNESLHRLQDAADKVNLSRTDYNTGVHYRHCNQDEHEGSCKYGDKYCPALPDTIPVRREVLGDLCNAMEGMEHYSTMCESWQNHEGREYIKKLQEALATLNELLEGEK